MITTSYNGKKIFTDLLVTDVKVRREDEGGCDFDMMIEGKFFNWRQNMDFTDRLWTILISKLIYVVLVLLIYQYIYILDHGHISCFIIPLMV